MAWQVFNDQIWAFYVPHVESEGVSAAILCSEAVLSYQVCLCIWVLEPGTLVC